MSLANFLPSLPLQCRYPGLAFFGQKQPLPPPQSFNEKESVVFWGGDYRASMVEASYSQ